MEGSVSTHQGGSAKNKVVKDGKIFQKVYMRAKRGKDKGRVTIKLKRLHVPVRMNRIGQTGAQEATDQLSSLDGQLEDRTIKDSKPL